MVATRSPRVPTGITDGIIAVVKRDCPTCVMVAPVLGELAAGDVDLITFTQDDPSFPETVPARDDTSLEVSWGLDVTVVPALVRVENGEETGRVEGWDRSAWEALTGTQGLASDLPDFRPGCGSLSVDPLLEADLAVRFGDAPLRARQVELGTLDDDMEAMFDMGWSDGLPLVPPTPRRVLAMLEGTSRDPDDVVAVVPPDLVECTVEKVAINAVMAGCRPEYLPVVLTAVEAACTDEFNMHGLLATTWFAGPVLVVNGPIAGEIGMNSGINALGQGNRANTTIGRALQLVVRNVGGGRPGEIDRATLGQPGKIGFAFAESEDTSPWEPLSVSRGAPAGTSAVTLFAGEAPRGVIDQLSRDPESLASSLAACLRTVAHPKLPIAFDAMLVVSPEHARVFRAAGWSRDHLVEELLTRLQMPGSEITRGTDGIAEGMPEIVREMTLPKFRPGGLLVAHAGGGAGLFSAIIGGWASGALGSEPVTREVRT